MVLTPASYKGLQRRIAEGQSQRGYWEGRLSVYVATLLPEGPVMLEGLMGICKDVPDPCLKEELPIPGDVVQIHRGQPLPRADTEWGSS